jgi:hypothetical protein
LNCEFDARRYQARRPALVHRCIIRQPAFS